ncbi:MAG: aminodeoxychorismate/anthranilate synthase component II [Planctomycetes bacterium]|nr:aminodeoxychorismate/anthranilate synthase component II [Planctomycetota bacterium]
MILFIDNYDSFTYNLVQLVGALGATPRVVRNDALSVRDCAALRPRALIISPGPGGPEGAGASVPLIQRFIGTVPILGVCLGHQCLAFACGGRIVRATSTMHGKTSPLEHDGRDLFDGVPQGCAVARYHSLMVDEASLPARFEVTARTAGGSIMGLADRAAGAYGIQFHPESFMTPWGQRMVKNFLCRVK